jgi:hypothetical protein
LMCMYYINVMRNTRRCVWTLTCFFKEAYLI